MAVLETPPRGERWRVSIGRRIARLVKRRAEPEPEAAPSPADRAEPEVEPETPREAVVNERTARALLASATPPLPPEPGQSAPRESVAPPPEPARSEPVSGEPRTWNLWELERAVRDAPDQERQEDWSALLIHLREFANADGDLPVEFDALVRESFAGVLAEAPTR